MRLTRIFEPLRNRISDMIFSPREAGGHVPKEIEVHRRGDRVRPEAGRGGHPGCAVLRMSMSVYLYRSRARDVAPLMMRIKEITGARVHYGYRRVHVLLRREGWKDNHKRVYRLYRFEGLSLRLVLVTHRRAAKDRGVATVL